MADPVNLLVITDAIIMSMLGDPRFQELLPCLNQANTSFAAIPKKCGKCQQQQKDAANGIMNALRSCIASARGTTLAQLKELFNARQLRISRVTSRGTGGTLTF